MSLMNSVWYGMWCLILLASPVWGQEKGPAPRAVEKIRPAQKSPHELAQILDRHLEAHWKANLITPAPLADDAEWHRRVSLDLHGVIPTVGESRRFLEDSQPTKRDRKITELFNRPAFLNHYSSVLRQTWLPQTVDNPQFIFFGPQFEVWLRKRLKEKAKTDQIVRDLLTAPTLFNRQNGPRLDGTNSAFTFNQVNEFKPENVASMASRLFMGIKIECAQCHNHPFAPYKKEQFWELAAFFAEVQPTIANVRDDKLKREIKIPDTSKVVQAKFFDGKVPAWDKQQSPRATFADWLTSKENPYFARNFANRLWAHFFGIGLIDPIDEPSDDNPPAIPAVLDELTNAFIASGYDLPYLMEAIVRTKAYQLSSRQTHPSQAESRHVARMTIKSLSGEQLYDSLALATGYVDPTSREQRAFQGRRRDFVVKFSSTEKITEKQKSILQALTMMNGNFVTEQTSIERSTYLDGISQSPFWNNRQKVEMLFLASLNRLPTATELERCSSYVDRGGVSNDAKKALSDVFWALLNSSEFSINH